MGEFENVQFLPVRQRKVKRNVPGQVHCREQAYPLLIALTMNTKLTQETLGIWSRNDRCVPTFHCLLSPEIL